MAFLDPANPAAMSDLYEAVDWARWRLQPFRQRRMGILKQWVGYWYSETGAEDRVPINLLQLAANVYLRQLVSAAPRAMVTAENPVLEPLAADMQAWMDKATKGMGLAEELRAFVLDAVFSMGIMKCGAAATQEIDVGGYNQLVGQPFAERVDLDDWVHDITARRADQCSFQGNRYRVSLAEARDNPLFDKTARERLSAMTRFAYNERGDTRAATLSQSTLQWIDEYEEHVELWDLWLPREKLVLTVPYSEAGEGGLSGPPLRVVEWKGPRDGPFITLGFLDVPNNVMPASPAQAWMDLHLLMNRVWRKMGRQSDRQKTVLGVAGPYTEDGERFIRASDGEAVRMDGGQDALTEIHLGGVDQQQMLFAQTVWQEFNKQAGNIEGMGGLSPQSHTLGQDELLNKSTSAQVGEMQDRVHGAFKKVYEHLAYWWWQDPVRVYSATRATHGGVVVPVTIPPALRRVPFDSLGYDVDPYSMVDDTPGMRGAKIMQLLQSFLIPSMPFMSQAGLNIDWPALWELVVKYQNMPELAKLIKKGPPPEQQGAAQMAQGAAGMPAQTTRTHIRKNVPMNTSRGQSQVMQQLLAGASPNAQNGVLPPGATR